MIRRFAMPKGSKVVTGGFLLIDRKVVECLKAMREQNRVIFGLVAWTGFDQVQVEYHRRGRVSRKVRLDPRSSNRRDVRHLHRLFPGLSEGYHDFRHSLFSRRIMRDDLSDPHSLHRFADGTRLDQHHDRRDAVRRGYLFHPRRDERISARIYFESTRRPLYFIAADTRPQDQRAPLGDAGATVGVVLPIASNGWIGGARAAAASTLSKKMPSEFRR